MWTFFRLQTNNILRGEFAKNVTQTLKNRHRHSLLNVKKCQLVLLGISTSFVHTKRKLLAYFG